MPKQSLVTRYNKYKLLLITILGFLLLSPFTQSLFLGRWLFAILFLLVMIGVAVNIKTPKHSGWTLPLLGGIVIVMSLLNTSLISVFISKLAALAFFTYAIFLFGKNVFLEKRHHTDHIFGSICIYLLIGITYATLFMAIHAIDAPALVYQQSGMPVENVFDFYYFSFITLTTVGFGDIIANNDLTKVVIMLESITGLFYLAVLVSSLIGMMHTKR